MTSAFAQSYGRKLFSKHLEQYQPADPLYEYYTTAKGKQKRRKRAAPPGLSARDAKILKSVQRRAHYLDKGFRVCGMRFGWTFVIGIVPGAGDVADAALNYVLVVRKAQEAEIPDWLRTRMLLNNAASIGLGLVPIAGDIALAAFKANSRNAALLEEFLRIRGEEFLKVKAEREGGGQGEGPKMSERDRRVVKPGAGAGKGEGMAAGEVADQVKGKGKGKSKSTKTQGQAEGRFVENVESGASSPGRPVAASGSGAGPERKKSWWRK
ncbi:hypothetical protein GLOTRDRAFT_77874 [Gloeophyllum trabeum ATCC 11539]|uniref:DUF4112 domain-containing protein n=1 Tax=Gloeophyllum trabeum (strain ATCC 11539 / FP-39264 / Madison 617) TaxID=670483 RepID=S7Q1X0_GLOTA|nr:uncharacterized protein GLOTRDRAFT_77874 [Gloeophyllum trabeum ATCC 11539]EPQ53991.1 hypothetical protein GLOTRDRAFT_77874 [Gloeophyllum trabeum ATCC 11539]